jgi:heptosyltransferase-1
VAFAEAELSSPQHGPKRILIIRLSAMGDVIHTLPAVAALRGAFPEATIDWLIEERWAELLCTPGTPHRGPRSDRRPLVDGIHAVKLVQWRSSLLTLATAQQIATVWNDVREMRYDIAIDLQGAIRSAILARVSGAREIFGAAEARESPASIWYTRKVITSGTHVIEQNVSLVEAIAQRKLKIPQAPLPHDVASEAGVCEMLAQENVQHLAIINPGAGWGAKRWPAERYGQVARALAERGFRSIINYGPGEESLAETVQAASNRTAIPWKCSISQLIALARRAQLFIGGDTGPLHLATALKVPVVAIFGPTDPARNGPYGTRSIVLRSPASLTTHARTFHPDAGLLEIGVDAVVRAARELIGEGQNA